MIFSTEGEGVEPHLPLHIQMQYVLAGFCEAYKLVEPALVREEPPRLDIRRVFTHPAVYPNLDMGAGLFRLYYQKDIAGMKSELKLSVWLRRNVLLIDDPLPGQRPLPVGRSMGRTVIDPLVFNRSVRPQPR